MISPAVAVAAQNRDDGMSEHLAGVHDAERVEDLFDTAHEVDSDWRGGGGKFVALQRAYAVLGGNRA